MWISTHLIAGAVVTQFFYSEIYPHDLFSFKSMGRLLAHSIFFDIVLLAMIYGGAQFILTKLGMQEQHERIIIWCAEVHAVFQRALDAVGEQRLDPHSLQIPVMRENLMPLINIVTIRGCKYIFGGWSMGLFISWVFRGSFPYFNKVRHRLFM